MRRRLETTTKYVVVAAGVAITTLGIGAWFALAPQAEVSFHPGVPTDHQIVANAVYQNYPQSFEDVSGLTEEASAANATKNVRLWGPTLRLNPGPQQVGDCTSWGGAHAVQCRAWVSSQGREQREVSTLFLYGLARVTIGHHKPPCNSDGGYPAYIAQGIEQRGFLFIGEAGLPSYSGSAAHKAGCDGPTPEQLQAAKVRAGGSVQPIPTVIAWRNALCAGYPTTVAIPWSPHKSGNKATTYTMENKRCLAFDGRNQGGHQICAIGFDGSSGKPFFYLFNSHGLDWVDRPLGDEPVGGVWVDDKWAEWIIQNGEVWAINTLPGFEPTNDLDWSGFESK